MANQPESATYDAGVFQLETTTPVQGGVGGASNAPLLNLANRTAYLKQHVDALEAGTFIPPTVAPINSPAFTGSPTAVTQTAGDNSTKLATDAFVQTAVGGLVTVDCSGGSNISLSQAQYGASIIVLSGTPTANINVIFPARSGRWLVVNATSGAYAVTCKTAAGAGVQVSQGKSRQIYGDATAIYFAHTDFFNIALTGAPTAPTPAPGDNSTKVATTAFVTASSISARLNADIISNENSDLATAKFISKKNDADYTVLLGDRASLIEVACATAARTLTLTAGSTYGSGWYADFANQNDSAYNLTISSTSVFSGNGYSNASSIVLKPGESCRVRYWYATGFFVTNLVTLGLAPLASPALTGNPTATTQAPGDNSTKLATTAFVATSFATLASPALTGNPTAPTQAPGNNSTRIATTAFVATSFATLASPALTGVPTAPTAAAGTNSTQIATTAFVVTSFAPLASPTFTGSVGLPATSFSGDGSMSTAGFKATAADDGTKTSGTYTPGYSGGNLRKVINNGAFTLAAPSAAGDYTLVIQITNGAAAGAITLTGFTKVSGNSFDTVNGHVFLAYITKLNGTVHLSVVGMF